MAVKIAAAVIQCQPRLVFAQVVFQIAQDFLFALGNRRCGDIFGRFADNAGAEIGGKRRTEFFQAAFVPPSGRDDELDVGKFRLPEKRLEHGKLAEHLLGAECVGGVQHAVEI